MCCENDEADVTFQKIGGFVCTEEGDGKYIAFDEGRNTGFILNRTSHAIWELCDGKRDIEGLKSELLRTFPHGIPDNLDQVIAEHLTILRRVGLIEEHTR